MAEFSVRVAAARVYQAMATLPQFEETITLDEAFAKLEEDLGGLDAETRTQALECVASLNPDAICAGVVPHELQTFVAVYSGGKREFCCLGLQDADSQDSASETPSQTSDAENRKSSESPK